MVGGVPLDQNLPPVRDELQGLREPDPAVWKAKLALDLMLA